MATITNIRIYTQSKAVPYVGYIAIDKVMMEGNTIVAMGGDVRYVLGVVPMENIVVDTPSVTEECGCSTTNANIFATLIKGVDGITPDMSDYYNKGQVDNKLSTKQDVISDIDIIRRNALKGATALQSVPGEYVTETELQNKGYATTAQVGAKQDKISDLDNIRSGAEKGATAVQPASLADYVSKDDVDAELSDTSTNPVQNQAVHTALEDIAYAFGQFLNQKQPVISDLEAIRDGAAKGATALQEHQPLKTINGESIIGEGNITIEGGGGGGGDLSGYATEEYVDNAVAEVNVKGEDGYVYSNGEKVDMRIRRSLIPIGTLIPAKANLNTIAYLKVGNYYCSQTSNAKTITNCPVEVAFSMEVFNPLSENLDDETTAQYTYRIRKITAYNTGVQYIQYCNTSGTAGTWTYGSWYVMPRTSFSLASDKNGGSAVKGGSTRGVYIDASGTFQQMGYTIAKSVPSNAVFTDTNTKVTSVDNHYTPAEDADAAINTPEGEVVIGLKRDAAGHVVGVMSTPMSSGGGGGGGGITVETDPIFSASPAASITEADKEAWNDKVSYSAKDFHMVYADGFMTSDGDGFVFPNTPAAELGFVLATLDDIPNALTESDITAMGFTKNTGTYSKPSGGIPKSDLATSVQESLSKANSAVQIEVVGGLTAVETRALYDGGMVYATPSAANGDEDDILLSRDTVKTINGESILGSGNITISGSGSAQLPLNNIITMLGGSRRAIPSGKVTELTLQQTGGGTFALSADKKDGEDNVWVIRFAISIDNSGIYQVVADEGYSIKWANGVAPTFENGKCYELSFRLIGQTFLGVWASFE